MKYVLLILISATHFIAQASEPSRKTPAKISITHYGEIMGIYISATLESSGRKELIQAQFTTQEYACARTCLLTGKETREQDPKKAQAILEQLVVFINLTLN